MKASAGARLRPWFSPILTSLVRAPAPLKLWVALFSLWALFLSGLIASPGIVQAIRLNSLLTAKQKEVAGLQEQIARLHGEAELLEKSRVVQLREIRRVLGYAGPGELIFDFSSGEDL
ncbi:MAG: septum formation initiator family protein [Oligoflexia bacterium]|nr:septum formation initiator family protein [Oligoflexia bacterium]